MNKQKYLFLLLILVTLLCSCSRETDVGARLLRVEGEVYATKDFVEYLSFSRPTTTLPLDSVILESYLNDFVHHKLLLHYATMNNPDVLKDELSISEEIKEVSKTLDTNLYANISVDEVKLREMYNNRSIEKRVEIQSLYFSELREAQQYLKILSSSPQEFEAAMERFNPAGMKESGFGQGTFSASQLPDEWRELIFRKTEPRIVGPIEIPNGFILVNVINFQEGTSFLERRDELELVYMTQQRSRAKEKLIERLKRELEIDFSPGVVLNSPVYTTK
jgi:hypothetical protein